VRTCETTCEKKCAKSVGHLPSESDDSKCREMIGNIIDCINKPSEAPKSSLGLLNDDLFTCDKLVRLLVINL
jgi:hypothetical protein